MGGLSACFLLLIVLLLAADVMFTTLDEFTEALRKKEIQAAFILTLSSCSLATILSLWIGTPLGYLLSRYRFHGRWFVETIVDIPIVLPPLVLGISLLILFHQPIFGFKLEDFPPRPIGFSSDLRVAGGRAGSIQCFLCVCGAHDARNV